MKVNINDLVRFKWRAPECEVGYVAHLQAEADRLGIAWGQYPKPKKPDADGWVEMALHEFMEQVYPTFRVGYRTPIEGNTLEFVRS